MSPLHFPSSPPPRLLRALACRGIRGTLLRFAPLTAPSPSASSPQRLLVREAHCPRPQGRLPTLLKVFWTATQLQRSASHGIEGDCCRGSRVTQTSFAPASVEQPPTGKLVNEQVHSHATRQISLSFGQGAGLCLPGDSCMEQRGGCHSDTEPHRQPNFLHHLPPSPDQAALT